MIFILYTMLLLFIDKQSAAAQCILALKQWYESMIPSLLPMMFLSSIVVDTGTAQKIGCFCNHTIFRFLRLSDNGCYCMLAGFLFGFPMGAKTTSDMLQHQAISQKEAQYLICFVNCIGPMYLTHFVYARFSQYALWKFLFCIYGISFLYGIILRYTLYQKETFSATSLSCNEKLTLLDAMYGSIPKCCRSILLLGGYMVFFQLSFLTASHLLQSINLPSRLCYPLLELTGGLCLLPSSAPFPMLCAYITFGGSCCFLQTYSFLKPANLSVRTYLLHKIILSILSCLSGTLFIYLPFALH